MQKNRTSNKCHRCRKYICKFHSQRSVAYLCIDCKTRNQNLKKKHEIVRKKFLGQNGLQFLPSEHISSNNL